MTGHQRRCCLHPATHYRPGQRTSCCVCGIVEVTGHVTPRGIDVEADPRDTDELVDWLHEQGLPREHRT